MDTILPFHTDLLDHNNEPDPAVEKYNPLKDRMYITGLVLLAISLGLFFWSPTRTGGGTLMDFFLLNYVFVWLYMVILWSAGRLRWWMFGARRAWENGKYMHLLGRQRKGEAACIGGNAIFAGGIDGGAGVADKVR